MVYAVSPWLMRMNTHHGKDGKFSSGDGGGATSLPDNIPADLHGNTREDGMWFDNDGGYMTDGYVEKYGKPETYSQFAHDHGDAYEVVLSEGGDFSIGYVRSGGPSDALYTREAANVRASGLTREHVKGLAADVEWASDRSSLGRPTNDAGEDIGGDTFGTGASRVNSGTGFTITSGSNGAVSIDGLGSGGKTVNFSEGEAGDMISSLRSMAEV